MQFNCSQDGLGLRKMEKFENLQKASFEDKQLANDWRHVQDKYKLKGTIGRGSFGEVVFAKDRINKHPVAIKQIRVDASNPIFVLKVIREV